MRREIRTTTRLRGYLEDWPGVEQVCRIDRHIQRGGSVTCESAFIITSLSREKANAGAILQLNRDHWRIENSYHWVLDAVLGEDRAKGRTGALPLAMHLLRGAVLNLLRSRRLPSVARARRRFACRPWEALRLVTSSALGREN